MRARHRAPADPRPRRRRYRLEPGWPGVALSIVDELADLLPRAAPEDAFAFFEPDPVHRFRPDGSLRIDTAVGTWTDDRTGEGGGIYSLLAKLLGSRRAARDWIRYDHYTEKARPLPPRRRPIGTPRRTVPDEEVHEVPLSAVLGRESVGPHLPRRTALRANCGRKTAARRSSGGTSRPQPTRPNRRRRSSARSSRR